ncbi:glycoside hydrolase family 15 protein [Allopontixanthobacter sp.]|uniref:glycoside hydrolase family 15 protein n=1 Tax=Allopontixanthobacter sp. TaxID=2906452 RepID=UPI002ABB5D40|nr:glycoside hydrolase family 15 protein [Allopontixanthobacter sp.]MDZ4307714.1 glycoside hydrolase family 15 protein [Allopontixanthobacter sp.]
MPKISDYALIGDCRTAALVSRSGSIDWMCLPDFSSPSVFAALIDPEKGGRFAITPLSPVHSERRYVPHTAVVETIVTTGTGTVRISDCLSVGDCASLQPQRELLRVVEGLEGRVTLDVHFDPRPGYAKIQVPVRKVGTGAFTCSSGNEHLLLRCDVSLDHDTNGRGMRGQVALSAGERVCFSLSYVSGDPAIILPLGDLAAERLERTARWWRDWSQSCTYEGVHREAVRRSAITLKQMTFAPSGAVVAAPTTSLPEAIGGTRNWDYRYCWLRDAALTMRAFLGLGLLDEAGAFLRWLLHATALTQPRLNIMYDIYGRTDLNEEELDHLAGYRGSGPVRIGNGAHDQIQLDVYGGVISAAVEFAMAGGRLQRDQLNLLAGFGRTVCAIWREPDHGIWEIRGEKRHYTFSKLMCWLALDCLLRLADTDPVSIDRKVFERERDAIRETIETRAWSEKLGSYSGALDEEWPDASLLLMSCLGYTTAAAPRMRATADRIRDVLGCDGLIYRYEHGRDGFESREGAFGICSFWAVDNLAMRGDLQEAEDLFCELLDRSNDVGLYSEEIDPGNGEFLGNFPQAFTHVGLINAAIALEIAKREKRA